MRACESREHLQRPPAASTTWDARWASTEVRAAVQGRGCPFGWRTTPTHNSQRSPRAAAVAATDPRPSNPSRSPPAPTAPQRFFPPLRSTANQPPIKRQTAVNQPTANQPWRTISDSAIQRVDQPLLTWRMKLAAWLAMVLITISSPGLKGTTVSAREPLGSLATLFLAMMTPITVPSSASCQTKGCVSVGVWGRAVGRYVCTNVRIIQICRTA